MLPRCSPRTMFGCAQMVAQCQAHQPSPAPAGAGPLRADGFHAPLLAEVLLDLSQERHHLLCCWPAMRRASHQVSPQHSLMQHPNLHTRVAAHTCATLYGFTSSAPGSSRHRRIDWFPHRQAGSACQHCCASSCRGEGQPSSKAGRSQPSQTPTQICASIRPSYTGVPLHISHTAPRPGMSDHKICHDTACETKRCRCFQIYTCPDGAQVWGFR